MNSDGPKAPAKTMSALSISCCEWPTWLVRAKVGQSQHWIERADISAALPPLSVSLAGAFGPSLVMNREMAEA